MNHNTSKPNPHINERGSGDDQLESRTKFAQGEGDLWAATAKQRANRREFVKNMILLAFGTKKVLRCRPAMKRLVFILHVQKRFFRKPT